MQAELRLRPNISKSYIFLVTYFFILLVLLWDVKFKIHTHCTSLYVVTEINVRQSGICHVFGQANSIVKSMDIGMHQSMMIFGPFFHNKSLLNDKIISHHICWIALGRICSATKPVQKYMQMNVNLIFWNNDLSTQCYIRLTVGPDR